MKITFKAKIIYDDPNYKDGDIITYEKINEVFLSNRKYCCELILPWDNSAEPTIIIKKTKGGV